MKTRKHKGSLTVEAAIVFSVVLLVVEAMLMTGIEVYKESSMTIRNTKVGNVGGIENFRKVQLGKDATEELLKKIKGE